MSDGVIGKRLALKPDLGKGVYMANVEMKSGRESQERTEHDETR
jgi:hypothetical protein